MIRPQDLLCPRPEGLYCAPGDFYIDPTRPVARYAVVTHGHSDHARAGHGAVLATPETLDIMAERYGLAFAEAKQAAAYGEAVARDEVTVTLVPAGHVLGSAQAVVRWKGLTMVVSGDYKRRRDPTCPAFEPVPCNVFISEATFGLPVFRHPADRDEIAASAALGGAVPGAEPPGGRLCAGQGAADHPPAAGSRLGAADLCAWGARTAERPLRAARDRPGAA